MADDKFTRYSDFWPYYLGEHAKPATRSLHFLGTAIGIVLLLAAILYGSLWLFVAAVVSGYLFAWIGHFFIEKNRPATFTYPVWSLASDFRMFFLWCAGQLEGELEKAGVHER